MCSVICLGHTTQVQQREIILVFLQTLPSQYLSLASDPITLIMGCLEGIRRDEHSSPLTSLCSLQSFLKESWRSVQLLQSLWGQGQAGAAPGTGCPTNRDVNATAFPERKLKPPSLNGTAVPRSSCQPGEVLLAAQAVELYLSLQ